MRNPSTARNSGKPHQTRSRLALPAVSLEGWLVLRMAGRRPRRRGPDRIRGLRRQRCRDGALHRVVRIARRSRRAGSGFSRVRGCVRVAGVGMAADPARPTGRSDMGSTARVTARQPRPAAAPRRSPSGSPVRGADHSDRGLRHGVALTLRAADVLVVLGLAAWRHPQCRQRRAHGGLSWPRLRSRRRARRPALVRPCVQQVSAYACPVLLRWRPRRWPGCSRPPSCGRSHESPASAGPVAGRRRHRRDDRRPGRWL